MASYSRAKNCGELRYACQRTWAPGSQRARRVGTTGAARAEGKGRARLSINWEWSLRAGKALPTVTPVTQGIAAREAIA